MAPDRKQVIDQLQEATNILVTVTSNPTIDQLSACLGLTLALNKAGKHATAVFSGEVPSTLEFLKPDETLEKTTDSLRDFIISLDKAKADKLRYKVEDSVVKIFITPYRTAISQDDFEYSQGDYNVDVIVALGVHVQQDLDQAITSHGRILHDAKIISINTEQASDLGSINIVDSSVSSLSELVSDIVHSLGDDMLDSQIATALLTGIVAETERFSNQKTSPATMTMSSQLMQAGANQQLVATQLQEPATPAIDQPQNSDTSQSAFAEVESEAPPTNEKPKEPGTLEIAHEFIDEPAPEEEPESSIGQIHVNDDGELGPLPEPTPITKNNRLVLHPLPPAPDQDGQHAPDIELMPAPAADAGLSLPSVNDPSEAPAEVAQPFDLQSVLNESKSESTVPASMSSTELGVDHTGETLAELERNVGSPHALDANKGDGLNYETSAPNMVGNDVADTEEDRDIDGARKAVQDAVAGLPVENRPLDPITALNAHPLEVNDQPAPVSDDQPSQELSAPFKLSLPQPSFEAMPTDSAADQPLSMPLPPAAQPVAPLLSSDQPSFSPPAFPEPPVAPAPQQPSFMTAPADPNAPPPLPPPMMPPSFGQPNQQ